MARFVSISALVLSALLLQASLASAQQYGPSVGFSPPEVEPRPPSGIAARIVGGVFLGLGVESLALLGLCGIDDMLLIWKSEHQCRVVNGTLGAIGLGIGIGALTLGILRGKKYKAWREARSRSALLFEHLELTSRAGASGLSWSTRF